MQEFRDSIITEFAKPNTVGRKEAFSDPDFQHLLRDAQQSYVRSGEERLREELVRLLVQRSAEINGSRMALILNRAIDTVGSLTPEDFAALCGIFVLKNCRVGAHTAADLPERMESMIRPFIQDMPIDNYSYEYLESLSLVTMSYFPSMSLAKTLHSSYAEMFMRDFSREQLDAITVNAENEVEVVSLLSLKANQSDNNPRYSFKVSKVEELQSELAQKNIDDGAKSRLTELFGNCLIPEVEIEAHLIGNVPSLAKIRDLWNTTALQQANLTALGKALAHSALVSQSDFQGSLNLWVR